MEAKNTSKPDGTADNHEKIPTEEPEATSVPAQVPASDSEQSQTENTKSSSDGPKHSQPTSAKVSAWVRPRPTSSTMSFLTLLSYRPLSALIMLEFLRYYRSAAQIVCPPTGESHLGRTFRLSPTSRLSLPQRGRLSTP